MFKKSLLLMLLMALLAPWAAQAQGTLTVHDGTTTNGNVPVYGWYADAYNKCEMVYPATELTDMVDGTITKLTFYASQANVSWGNADYQVFLTEISETSISAFAGPGTVVYTGALSISGNQMAVNFTTPFVYGGGNLLVGVYQTTKGGYATSSWYGESATGASGSGYSYNSLDECSFAQRNFLPKTTFSYTPAGAVFVAAPSNLSATLTPGDGTVATLAWNENGTASQWEICLDGDEANLIPANINPFQLTGLTPERSYTAKVRATTADGNSDWSDEISFTPTNDYFITVNDGTNTNSMVPVYGLWVDNKSYSQFIIPAADLAAMQWGTINKLTFYSSDANVAWYNAMFEVYMTVTTDTILSALADWSTMDKVMNEAHLEISGNQMVVTLDAPYEYVGDNLMVGVKQTVSGSYAGASFYGVTATKGASMGGYGTSVSQQSFLPKTTFEYIPGSAPTCLKPTDLAVSNITAHSATLSWTENGTASEWVVAYSENNVEFREVAANSNPFTLTELNDGTEIFVKVQANCGSGDLSSWSSTVNFTTLEACPTPTNLVISDITAMSANVGWTSTGENFELRYTSDIDPDNDFETSSLRGWTNIDADGDGYVWVLGSEAAGIYHNDGVDVTGNGHNSSYDFIISGSFSNAAGTALTPDNYLVSPQITLGGSISFWAQAQDASYCNEHFGVAVSTTNNTDPAAFTTIQEWTITNDDKGTVRMLRSSNAPRGVNRATTDWVQYTVDLSAYSGQGYVAIRHFNCTDMFLLNLDDIVVVQPGGFQPTWTNVPNATNPQALTGLDDETTYFVQVRANCGSDGYSRWLEGSFTTNPACVVPTGLTITNIDKRSADLTWTPNGEETAWQININNGETDEVIDVTDTTYNFTGLTPETRYIVKVRASCDTDLQSDWSTPTTFTTLVACPAPTNLAISDITNVSAVASWVYEGDVELQYAEDVWKHYDNGVYATTMGAGGTLYWGMMLPAATLTPGTPLTNVALHTSYAGEATLNVYLGGDQPTGTPAATQTFTMLGDGDFMEITLDTPVAIDGTQNLWITFYQSGLTYPADGCTGPTDPNGRWVSLDGEEWADIAGYGYDYTWMIRAAFGNNTQEEWLPVRNPATPQAITDLTPETTYMVRLRAVCGGEDGESVWVTTNFTTDVACPAPEALGATPYANSAELSWEGTSESYTVKYGYDEVGETLYSQDFAGGIPTGWVNDTTYAWTVVDGYIKSSNAGVGSSTSTISFTTTVSTDANFEFDAQCMGEGTSTAWDKCIFSIDNTEMFRKGANGEQWDHYSFPITAGEHTFTWSYSKDSSVDPTGDYFAVDNIAINVVSRVWNTITATTTECIITGLTPATIYYVQVQGNCGDEFGSSEWSEIISFTTTNDLCPVPTALAVVDSLITANTAYLTWNGSPDVESFTVRYRSPEHVEGGLSEAFNTNSIPTGWTRYTGLVDQVVAGTAQLTTTTYGWQTNSYAMGQYNMKVNVYGTNCKYWLVTPEVTPANGNITFDLALTAYNSNNAIANDTLQADDRFVVLVYADSTWTILREWNNSGSAYVYNDIDSTAQHVSIDLSAYVGQAIKVAFYCESTNLTGVANTGGDNDMHIDNVVIGNPQTIPATDWVSVEDITDMNVILTGLTPETPYEAQVQNVCSPDSIWSNAVTFTTLVQTSATQTIALAGSTYVSFRVEVTLDELKAALVEALPGTSITIQGKTQSAKYNGSRWTGQLRVLDVSQLYIIKVESSCEIELEGMPVDPAEHPITIVNGNNYIAYPFNETMSVANAFAGFAVSGDKLQSKTQNASYNGTRWTGQLRNLEPGQGYIYKSATTEARTFTFPDGAK